jgi:hypothetical protein
MLGEGSDVLRVRGEDDEAVEIAVPAAVRARAEEIARLSRRLGDRGGGFTSAREVLAPALIFGLAHLQERYAQAALRDGAPGGADGRPPARRPLGSGLTRDQEVLEGEEGS